MTYLSGARGLPKYENNPLNRVVEGETEKNKKIEELTKSSQNTKKKIVESNPRQRINYELRPKSKFINARALSTSETDSKIADVSKQAQAQITRNSKRNIEENIQEPVQKSAKKEIRSNAIPIAFSAIARLFTRLKNNISNLKMKICTSSKNLKFQKASNIFKESQKANPLAIKKDIISTQLNAKEEEVKKLKEKQNSFIENQKLFTPETNQKKLDLNLKTSKNLLSEIKNLSKSIKRLKNKVSKAPKEIQAAINQFPNECKILKDKCQNTVNYYEKKQLSFQKSLNPPNNQHILNQANHQNIRREENFNKSPAELTKAAQYMANTYEGASIHHMLLGNRIDVNNTPIFETPEKSKVPGANFINVPEQLAKDIPRSRIALNGKFLSNPEEARTRKISTNYQVAEKLQNEFGEEGLNKIGHIMHQSLFAEMGGELFKGRNIDEIETEPPLGFGSLGNLTPISFADREFGGNLNKIEKEKVQERFKDLCPMIFNLEKKSNGDIIITGSMAHRFNGGNTDKNVKLFFNTFCFLNVQVTISEKEFAKKTKDMKVTVKASVPKIVKGIANLENLAKQNENSILKGSIYNSEYIENKKELKNESNEGVLQAIKETAKEEIK